jgi:heme/copper-type cytochrome/quinol oxidase subunit 3
MSTHEGLVADAEDPAVLGANLAVGARLLASAVVFFFMAFVFAFFYLRSLNTNHDFHPAHTNPPTGFGVAILLCVIGSTAVFELARRALDDGRGSPWRIGALLAFVLSLAAVVVQVIEYYNLPFGAGSGGLASVFLGFTVVFSVFWLGAVYWIETLWAQSLRQPPSAPADGVAAPSRQLRPSADACAVFLYVMVLVEVFAFVLLYLVK